jgi:hypothetical protein
MCWFLTTSRRRRCKDVERRDFLEICDRRYQSRSMVLTSQVPTEHWHEQIGDPTIADILDRPVHESTARKRFGRQSFSIVSPTLKCVPSVIFDRFQFKSFQFGA